MCFKDNKKQRLAFLRCRDFLNQLKNSLELEYLLYLDPYLKHKRNGRHLAVTWFLVEIKFGAGFALCWVKVEGTPSGVIHRTESSNATAYSVDTYLENTDATKNKTQCLQLFPNFKSIGTTFSYNNKKNISTLI